MPGESGLLDCAGAASVRRNTSGEPTADPADNSGRAAGIIGMPATCGESAVRESGAAGDPLPASGPAGANVVPVTLAAAALRASIGTAAIPRESGLTAGTMLAVSWLDDVAGALTASTFRLTTPAGAREIDGAGAASTGAAAADSLDVTP